MRKVLGLILWGLLVAAPAGAQLATSTPTKTSTATGTVTQTGTSTATGTVTQTPTATATGTATFTSTATRTLPPTKTITATRTSTATYTATPTPTATVTNTATATATVTVTGNIPVVPDGNAGCVVLSATPQLIGRAGLRQSLVYWASTGPASCGYDTNLSLTPGAGTGAIYETGRTLQRCKGAAMPLYCVGTGATVCFDELVESTPTATATP